MVRALETRLRFGLRLSSAAFRFRPNLDNRSESRTGHLKTWKSDNLKT